MIQWERRQHPHAIQKSEQEMDINFPNTLPGRSTKWTLHRQQRSASAKSVGYHATGIGIIWCDYIIRDIIETATPKSSETTAPKIIRNNNTEWRQFETTGGQGNWQWSNNGSGNSGSGGESTGNQEWNTWRQNRWYSRQSRMIRGNQINMKLPLSICFIKTMEKQKQTKQMKRDSNCCKGCENGVICKNIWRI